MARRDAIGCESRSDDALPTLLIARPELLGLRRIAAGVLLSLAASAQAGEWKPLDVLWSIVPDVRGAWHVGGTDANPVANLPVEVVRGPWVRFSAVAEHASSGIGIRVNAWRERQFVASSPPAKCNGDANRQADPEAETRCTATLWVPADVTDVRAVVYATRHAGDVRSLAVEVAAVDEAGPSVADRVVALVDTLEMRYYRTDEVDWPIERRRLRAIPAPPQGTDPVPAIAQLLRQRMPGHQHMSVSLKSAIASSAATARTPECNAGADPIANVVLPGITAVDGDAPARYAEALRGCLLSRPDGTAWVVDLRGNSGGNTYPMIAGVGPLLPAGDLYSFLNGGRVATVTVGIAADGVQNNGHIIASIPTDVGSRTRGPVIVVLGPRCTSSCEQVANALGARPRTLFVGEPTGGFTSANVVYPLNDDYVLLLTNGYTADPCGRPIVDRLTPDVALAPVDARTLDDVLAVPAVAAWLDRTARRALEPVSTDERSARCAASAVAGR